MILCTDLPPYMDFGIFHLYMPFEMDSLYQFDILVLVLALAVRGTRCNHLQSKVDCTRISLGDFELSKMLQQHKGFVSIDVGIL